MRYEYITKIEIKFDKKKTFKRKSIKYLQNFIIKIAKIREIWYNIQIFISNFPGQ